MHWFLQGGEPLFRLIRQAGVALRHVNDIFDQRPEFIPARKTVISYAIVFGAFQNNSRNTFNVILIYGVPVFLEILDLDA